MAQRLRGTISADVANNRLGHATASRPEQPVVWVHAASLGELSAVRPFLRHFAHTRPDRTLLITTNNPAALDIAATWQDVPAVLQAAPFDIPAAIENFLNHWRPSAFANVESEVWPNRFNALAKHGIPCIGLNARMSDGSAKRLAKLGPSVGLHHFKAIFAQNEPSGENYRRILGPDSKVEVIPNFKSFVTLPDPDPALITQFDRSKTILAASTHLGEDEYIIAAFAKLVAQNPSLKLIIAPRHPARAKDVAPLVQQAELIALPLGSTENGNVYIVETLGQLPYLYALAAVTFVGGSLLPDIGGHTPYEPIRANSAIVAGSMTANFTTEFTMLSTANACLITTPNTLAIDLQSALSNTSVLAENARNTLPPISDPTELLNRITATLDPRP